MPISPLRCVLVLWLVCLPAWAAAPTFKVYLADAGVYRIDYADLNAVGLTGELPSAALALSTGGQPVPVHIADGGDGRFGPGDHMNFVGQHLAGDNAYYSEHSAYNVYLLTTAAKPDGRTDERLLPIVAATAQTPRPLLADVHLEQDKLRLRFAADADGSSPEVWYWAKLAHIDPEPFRYPLDLPALDTGSTRPVALAIQLRGWSTPRHKPAPDMPDHHVAVSLNGQPLGSARWDGSDTYLFSTTLPAAALQATGNSLELRIPVRQPPGAEHPLVDVAMLNWLEVHYPRLPHVGDTQAEVRLDPADAGWPVVLTATQPFALYSNSRYAAPARGGFQPAADETRFWIVPEGRAYKPTAIQLDQPSDLRHASQQSDYLMITHPRLRAALEPLADFHRRRGLSVTVIDIDDIYDEFNHGIVHPRAIRDFLSHAYHQWSKPAPRFVLLAGDASWEVRNAVADDRNYADWTYGPFESTNLLKNGSIPYADATTRQHRNLIPSYGYATYQGLAASDNWFVAVDGDDFYPDMAIGRWPVTEPAEVSAIVDKTIRHIEQSQVGPWRRRILWITDQSTPLQQISDVLAGQLNQTGFASDKVYPQAADPDNHRHQARLREAFDQGPLLVHFLGHGGRYIWRTGPPDLKKNHDLFTLDDLDQLKPSTHLPVVLAMTCYSAPFDHPTADSIGEKFLRITGRGAVGVLAASWRNSPDPRMSQKLMQAFAQPGTVGEAIMHAKHEVADRLLVETYNLLGDPAVPFTPPQLPVTLALSAHDATTLTAAGTVASAGFSGKALVEVLDSAGEVLASREDAVQNGTFTTALTAAAPLLTRATQLRAYVWNTATNQDGMGHLNLPSLPETLP